MSFGNFKSGGNKVGRKRILLDRECSFCKKSFRPSSSLIRFCSFECSRKLLPKKGKMLPCAVCGKQMYRHQNTLIGKKHRGGRYFCSRKCQKEGSVVDGSKRELKCKQ